MADEVRELADGLVVSAHGSRLYLYAGTEDAARQAQSVVLDVLARRQLTAEFALDR